MTTSKPEISSRHWRVLRTALLQSMSPTRASTSTESTASEFFPRYPKVLVDNIQGQPNWVWMTYELGASLSNANNPLLKKRVYVHEKRKDVTRVPVTELLSHRVYQGVDNTGNIRTWPSEEILLAYLLSSGVCSQVQQQRDAADELLPIACCELGSGMVGLASLGLLACGPVALQRVLVTDGNPLCVQNLHVCMEENKRQNAFAEVASSVDLSTELLRWERTAKLRHDLQHAFDLVFASDCLFFEAFHEDLAYTIKTMLRPKSGRCLLLQPSRNGSMERFCCIAKRHGFVIEESRDYDPLVVQRHAELQQTRGDYVPDVHFPVLLTLTIS
uniref:Calmodulin-lysine N-methyltransferase n=1 Tax=Hyaloperonospora arabidopsidis (strain Emoy2) TaxID=559515 RepID=M4C179_HYAAE